MTLIVSMTHPKGIIMASDSYFVQETRSELGTGEYAETSFVVNEVKKTYEIKGTGCLSFWGDWTEVGDPRRLVMEFVCEAEQAGWDVEIASLELEKTLEERIDRNCEVSMGFHLGGFSTDGIRKLYHVFHGTQWNQLDKSPSVHRNPEDVGADKDRYRILYNGEPKVTANVIRFLRRYQDELRIPVFPRAYGIEKAVEFAVFLIRYTHDEMAETCGIPTVGGRVNIAVVRDDNSVKWQKRDPRPVDRPSRDWPLQRETGANDQASGQKHNRKPATGHNC